MQASPPAHALTVFRRPLLGASPRLSSAFELPAVVGALGYSLSPVQVRCWRARPPHWLCPSLLQARGHERGVWGCFAAGLME